MKFLIFLLAMSLSLNVLSHGGDDGPSSLEDEFSKTGHLHLPINYSLSHGLSFNYDNHLNTRNEQQDESHDEHHADESGLELNFHPVIYAGQDQFVRYINQERASDPSFNIESSTDESHYLRIENKKWDLGLGSNLEAHLPIDLFSGGIGLSYIKGKNYYTIQNLNSRHEKRPFLRLPFSEQEFSNWRIGDQIAFAAKSNLIINSFIGIEPFVHLGPEISISGIYRFKAELKKNSFFEIQLTQLKNTSIGIEASAFPFFLEANKGHGKIYALTYAFDLSKPESFRAIQNLFHGRIDLTNKLLIKYPQSIQLKVSGKNQSSSFSLGLVIPGLFTLGKSDGVYIGQTEEEEMEDHETHQNQNFNAIIQNEKFTRGFLSNHFWENKTIASSILRGHDARLGAIFSWSLSKDKMKPQFLNKKIRKMSWILKDSEHSDFHFPMDQLGYLKFDFIMNFNGSNILDLLNLNHLKKLKTKALIELKNDFLNLGHRAFCKFKKFDSCYISYSNHIQKKMDHLEFWAKSINGAYTKNEIAEIPLKISKMIGSFLQSKYLLKALKKSPNPPEIFVLLEGEKIKKHKLPY